VTLETIDGKKLKETLAGGKGGDLLALFTARWCGYCRRLREELLESKLGVRAVEVDVSDEEDPAWDDWHIELVPTVVLFRAGAEIGRKPPASIRGLTVDEIRDFLAAAPPR
jgi:thiol-disulfide isomerase/thioredoxin